MNSPVGQLAFLPHIHLHSHFHGHLYLHFHPYLTTQKYLKSGKFTNKMITTLFILRCGSKISSKLIFAIITDFKCFICKNAIDTQEHALKCHVIKDNLNLRINQVLPIFITVRYLVTTKNINISPKKCFKSETSSSLPYVTAVDQVDDVISYMNQMKI